jgi:endonuclease YncB( thermonuclease family)
MLHHHKHGIKQSIFAFIVVFLACTGMFLALRPNLYSSASPKNIYIPPEGAVLKFPDGAKEDSAPISIESKSKSRNIYTVQPQGLPKFKVTEVVDGNTIILEGITRIRLIGIKAPDQDEEYGIEATDFLKGLVEKREIYFQMDEKNPRDDLGRLRGIIYR